MVFFSSFLPFANFILKNDNISSIINDSLLDASIFPDEKDAYHKWLCVLVGNVLIFDFLFLPIHSHTFWVFSCVF